MLHEGGGGVEWRQQHAGLATSLEQRGRVQLREHGQLVQLGQEGPLRGVRGHAHGQGVEHLLEEAVSRHLLQHGRDAAEGTTDVVLVRALLPVLRQSCRDALKLLLGHIQAKHRGGELAHISGRGVLGEGSDLLADSADSTIAARGELAVQVLYDLLPQRPTR